MRRWRRTGETERETKCKEKRQKGENIKRQRATGKERKKERESKKGANINRDTGKERK